MHRWSTFASTCFLVGFLTLAAGMASAENASNPLASVSNLDTKMQYTYADPVDRYDAFLDGAQMLMPVLKLKYELHYNFTDATGSEENDFEKLVLKPIYFPSKTKLNEDWGLKTAVGLDWTIEFNNEDKGIGVGADTIAPFVGVALNRAPSGLVLIPLLQHFVSYRSSDTDVSLTSLRLIAIRPFGSGYWGKLDAKIPYDWENENWLPTAEVQLGYNINELLAVFVEALIGIGKDRPYDGGGGLGLRLKY